MVELDEDVIALPAESGPSRYVRYSEARADEICARVAAGENVAAICRGDGMPHRLTVREWAAQHPEFDTALAAAREAARLAQRRRDLAVASRARDPRGLWSTYTPEVGAAICARLAAGQNLTEICQESWTPTKATIFNWARQIPEFADAYAMARMLAVHRFVDAAREVMLAVEPETVDDARGVFDMLRAATARIAPRKYLEPSAAVRATGGGAGV